MDAATEVVRGYANARNVNDDSYFRKMSRLFSQYFCSKRRQMLDCLQQKTAKKPLLSDWVDPTQSETTISKLLERDAAHFHNLLALDKREIALTNEIGIYMCNF